MWIPGQFLNKFSSSLQNRGFVQICQHFSHSHLPTVKILDDMTDTNYRMNPLRFWSDSPDIQTSRSRLIRKSRFESWLTFFGWHSLHSLNAVVIIAEIPVKAGSCRLMTDSCRDRRLSQCRWCHHWLIHHHWTTRRHCRPATLTHNILTSCNAMQNKACPLYLHHVSIKTTPLIFLHNT